MPNRIDTAMDWMQPPTRDPLLHSSAPTTHRQHLPPSHNPVLPPS